AARPPGPGAPASPAASPGATEAPTTPAGVWKADVLREFQPLTGSSFSAVRTIVEWNEGRATPADVAARIDAAVPLILQTQTSLDGREPFPGAPDALVQYRAAADLYLDSLLVVRTATTVPAGPLQDQLRAAGARQRDLGDRLFDLASTTLAPLLPPVRAIEGVEVRKPPEVPDYSSIDLGVGPPLESQAPSPRPVRVFQDSRAVQSLADWLQDVQDADVPTDTELAQALGSGTASELAGLARRLRSASDQLYARPDPEGGRVASTQVQLSLLVQSEAARVAQAATLLSGKERSDLRLAAQGLAGVGDDTWDRRLGARSTVAGTPS
ncbi:MAG: hypothetical protein JWN08_1944, partial [Frankiales bacterium]|nr:hypothetical protein [Frankiales bacterium]